MQLIPLKTIGEVKPKATLHTILINALQTENISLKTGDIVVIAQKIVSKAEGQYRDLAAVPVTAKAQLLAQEVDKDPRLVQLILNESSEVIRKKKGVLIVEHINGYVHANAGIDQSNIRHDTFKEPVLLLPKAPDKSAQSLASAFNDYFNIQCGIIINDSAGRAWREGTLGFAIGTAGFNPLLDLIGKKDREGRVLQMTKVAVADELAAAASYLMGQADEGIPAVVIRDANPELGCFKSQPLIRDKSFDLFR